MSIRNGLVSGIVAAAAICDAGGFLTATGAEPWDGTIVQHGKMHEAIGRQQHHERIRLKQVVERPHFYGVAALAKLEGEATIIDGKATVTRVGDMGRLETDTSTPLDRGATLLVGAYVPSWTEHKLAADVRPDDLDIFLADAAAKAALATEKPFVFTLEGEFVRLRLHVIHGACPLHARLMKIELPKDRRPVEIESESVRGTVVGIFAKGAVGDITHPATSTHMHLVFQDEATKQTVTGHVEQIGVRAGAILRLPKSK